MACSSDDDGTGPSTGDTTPPARINDLSAELSNDGSAVRLGWTAPGDDGSEGEADRYDLRYLSVPLTALNWSTAAEVIPRPRPGVAGEAQSHEIEVADGIWYFGIRTADEVPNWSAVSNVAMIEFTRPDLEPPAAVTDLEASSSNSSSVTLTWTAPGDDGSQGTAETYDVRYDIKSITEETWEDATRVADVPDPSEAGSAESMEVSELAPSTEYFFALRTLDEAENESEFSNVAGATTPAPGRTRLTTSSEPLGARQADWSPDGARIVFTADWFGDVNPSELYMIPSGGGTIVPLTNDPIGARNPRWRPDGQRISYVASRAPVNELWIIDATPGAAAELLHRHEEEWNIVSHCWSPDGARIAYLVQVGFPPDDEVYHDLFVVPAQGGDTELLVGGSRISGLDWSPDGTQIAYAIHDGDSYDIWTVPPAGGDPVRLTDSAADETSPAWSPDGSRIAYSSDGAGNADLWLMNADGTSPRRLTSEPEPEYQPDWSPNGDRLVFSVDGGGFVHDIWILDLE